MFSFEVEFLFGFLSIWIKLKGEKWGVETLL